MKVRVFIEIKSGRWTVWSEDGKQHIGYRRSLFLKDAVFHVNNQKRIQIKRTGKRMPHAWVTGTLITGMLARPDREVTYCPFTHKGFQSGKKKVAKAPLVLLNSNLKVFI